MFRSFGLVFGWNSRVSDRNVVTGLACSTQFVLARVRLVLFGCDSDWRVSYLGFYRVSGENVGAVGPVREAM